MTPKVKKTHLKKHHKGMTFIEVLISLVILSTGIFGAVAMQASAKKGSFDAMQRSVASALAQDILERMRSNNSDNLFLNAYNGTDYGSAANGIPGNPCTAIDSNCTNAQMATADLYEWELNLLGADVTNSGVNNGGLAGALACIQHVNNVVTVVISWEGREETSDGAASNSAFAQACGTGTTKRRQIVVDGFIF